MNIENRWFPPSPHKEAVLEFLNKGRAHIEERGHNMPPLLVFEDGGVMELPRVRYKDGQFFPDESSPVSRQTNYNDVCGTINEFKNILENQPEKTERLFELLDDVCYLLSRMQRRRENYKQAVEAVGSVYERLKEIKGPDVIDAYQKAEELKSFISAKPSQIKEKLDELFTLAEGIRDVANHMEQEALYPYRDLFIELGKIYFQIKGSRAWETK